MSAIEEIKQILVADADSTAASIAAKIGVSRQRVHQICKANGIALADGRRRGGSATWINHFGGHEALSSHFVGGASELTTCADLLRRGIPVYRAVTFVSAADLVIDFRGSLLRVEVKSAKRNNSNSLRYPMPADRSRYDILALVEPSGAVTYKPDPFNE